MTTQVEGDWSTGQSAGRAYSFSSVAVATLASMAAAIVLTFAYVPILHYVPLIYINALVTMGMGWAIGHVAAKMARAARIHDPVPAGIVGVAAGICALWFSWIAYLWVIYEFDFSVYWFALLHPLAVLEEVVYLAHNPVWSIGKGGDPVYLYYGAWLAEAAVLVYMPAKGCLSFVKENAICGNCLHWLGATGDVARFSAPDEEATVIAKRLEDGEVTLLPTLRRLKEDDEATSWFEAVGYACANCPEEDSRVSVIQVTMKPGKDKKKLERHARPLLRFAPIPPAQEQSLFEPVVEGADARGVAGEETFL